MFTKSELEHVNKKYDVPYRGDEYARYALENLSKSLRIFNEYYRGKKYTITLSNGSEIEFEINQGNLAHMLGLELPIIRQYYESLKPGEKDHEFFNWAYNQKDMAINHALLYALGNEDAIDETIALFKRSGNSILNFFRIGIRTEAFNRFSNFMSMDFGCIDFDSSKYCNGTEMKSDKFLFVESNEINAPFFMIGIAKSEDKRYIETIFADTNSSKMFNNQTILLPISVTVEDKNNLIRKEATATQKIAQYRQLLNVVKTYGCYLDIYFDYENTLSRQSKVEIKQMM